jgi:hypothetical protein
MSFVGMVLPEASKRSAIRPSVKLNQLSLISIGLKGGQKAAFSLCSGVPTLAWVSAGLSIRPHVT